MAAAGQLTEPQTAAGIVSFLLIRPVNVFLKQNAQIFLLLSYILLPQLCSHGFNGPFLYVKDVGHFKTKCIGTYCLTVKLAMTY